MLLEVVLGDGNTVPCTTLPWYLLHNQAIIKPFLISKGRFTKWRKILRCINSRNAQIYYLKSLGFLDDQTQERNAEEHKDRIRVYPSVVLRFYKRRREDDAMQRIV